MLASLQEALSAVGLAHVGAIARARFDEVAPPGFRLDELAPHARSVVIAASGGGAFWRGFRAFCDVHAGWVERANPLDDYTREVVGRACAPFRVVRIFYPFADFEPRLPFQRLGELAALGHFGPLGLLVHTEYGPWFALRAAIALDVDVAERDRCANVCSSCAAKPCIAACPAGAVTVGGWDVPTCLSQRARGAPCSLRCDARAACPIGVAHRYSNDEIEYHHRAASGQPK